MLTATPRVRIVGHGNRLRVRTKGDWEGNALVALRESCRASVAVEKAVAEAIDGARTAGNSWQEIGQTLGVAEDADCKQRLIDACRGQPARDPRTPASTDELTDRRTEPRIKTSATLSRRSSIIDRTRIGYLRRQ